jgi:L-serine kinase (ATP) / ParB family transcriptional regulator, heme-responsive regulator
MSTEQAPRLRLPDLRFVAVEALIPHEQHDPLRSAPLVERLRAEGVLRNPPIVTPLPPDDARFVVLDGANRATAAAEAGLPHLVVQVVRYEEPGLRLTTWHHALVGVPADDFERSLGEVAGLTRGTTDLPHARAVLARRDALAFVAFPGGRAVTLHGAGELRERNAVLNAVVDRYRGRVRLHRVASDSLADARTEYPEVTALVVFPHFEPAEVLELATSGARLPAGITRHVIPWRALRLNVPLERLADRAQTAEEKNRWLAEWLREKIVKREVRFYQESTVLFDE